jgi:hypothetical protein
VARRTFTFQRDLLLKKAIIERIIELLDQLYYMRKLTGQSVFAEADEVFMGLPQKISETMASVKALEFLLSAPASANVKRVRYVVHGLRQESVFAQDHNTPNVTLSAQLGDAISALHNIYRTEIK